MSEGALRRLYRDAALIINLHGGTEPRRGVRRPARSTWRPIRSSCRSSCTTASPRPTSSSPPTAPSSRSPRTSGGRAAACRSASSFHFMPTRQPVVLEHWAGVHADREDRVHDRRQLAPGLARRSAIAARPTAGARTSSGATFLDLPARTGQAVRARAQRLPRRATASTLEAKGWRVRQALDFSTETAPTATTSPARAASSRSPRTRTSACARAGSATAARPTSRAGGPS